MVEQAELEQNGWLHVRFLGLSQPYAETLALMHETHEAVARKSMPSQLLLLEHSPVITITRQHMHKSITTSPEAIRDDSIDLIVADRGGDATFHGPGQLVGYPIIALGPSWCLSSGGIDIERYIRTLEQSLLAAMRQLKITSAMTVPGFTGIWCRCDSSRTVSLKKLIAIGVGIKDGVSKHGFALNMTIDHARFAKHIVPCGLKDRGVITLQEACNDLAIAMPSYEKICSVIASTIARGFGETTHPPRP